MKNGFLVLVPFLVLTAACKGNNGKTAGTGNVVDPRVDTTHIGRNSRRMEIYQFLQQQPNLNSIVRNGRNGAVQKIRLRFSYNGMFDYKLRTNGGVAGSIERGYGQAQPAPDYRAGLVLRSGAQIIGQVMPFTTSQGVICANVILHRNRVRPAVGVTVCEESYSDINQNDNDNRWDHRRRY